MPKIRRKYILDIDNSTTSDRVYVLSNKKKSGILGLSIKNETKRLFNNSELIDNDYFDDSLCINTIEENICKELGLRIIELYKSTDELLNNEPYDSIISNKSYNLQDEKIIFNGDYNKKLSIKNKLISEPNEFILKNDVNKNIELKNLDDILNIDKIDKSTNEFISYKEDFDLINEEELNNLEKIELEINFEELNLYNTLKLMNKHEETDVFNQLTDHIKFSDCVRFCNYDDDDIVSSLFIPNGYYNFKEKRWEYNTLCSNVLYNDFFNSQAISINTNTYEKDFFNFNLNSGLLNKIYIPFDFYYQSSSIRQQKSKLFYYLNNLKRFNILTNETHDNNKILLSNSNNITSSRFWDCDQDHVIDLKDIIKEKFEVEKVKIDFNLTSKVDLIKNKKHLINNDILQITDENDGNNEIYKNENNFISSNISFYLLKLEDERKIEKQNNNDVISFYKNYLLNSFGQLKDEKINIFSFDGINEHIEQYDLEFNINNIYSGNISNQDNNFDLGFMKLKDIDDSEYNNFNGEISINENIESKFIYFQNNEITQNDFENKYFEKVVELTSNELNPDVYDYSYVSNNDNNLKTISYKNSTKIKANKSLIFNSNILLINSISPQIYNDSYDFEGYDKIIYSDGYYEKDFIRLDDKQISYISNLNFVKSNNSTEENIINVRSNYFSKENERTTNTIIETIMQIDENIDKYDGIFNHQISTVFNNYNYIEKINYNININGEEYNNTITIVNEDILKVDTYFSIKDFISFTRTENNFETTLNLEVLRVLECFNLFLNSFNTGTIDQIYSYINDLSVYLENFDFFINYGKSTYYRILSFIKLIEFAFIYPFIETDINNNLTTNWLKSIETEYKNNDIQKNYIIDEIINVISLSSINDNLLSNDIFVTLFELLPFNNQNILNQKEYLFDKKFNENKFGYFIGKNNDINYGFNTKNVEKNINNVSTFKNTGLDKKENKNIINYTFELDPNDKLVFGVNSFDSFSRTISKHSIKDKINITFYGKKLNKNSKPINNKISKLYENNENKTSKFNYKNKAFLENKYILDTMHNNPFIYYKKDILYTEEIVKIVDNSEAGFKFLNKETGQIINIDPNFYSNYEVIINNKDHILNKLNENFDIFKNVSTIENKINLFIDKKFGYFNEDINDTIQEFNISKTNANKFSLLNELIDYKEVVVQDNAIECDTNKLFSNKTEEFSIEQNIITNNEDLYLLDNNKVLKTIQFIKTYDIERLFRKSFINIRKKIKNNKEIIENFSLSKWCLVFQLFDEKNLQIDIQKLISNIKELSEDEVFEIDSDNGNKIIFSRFFNCQIKNSLENLSFNKRFYILNNVINDTFSIIVPLSMIETSTEDFYYTVLGTDNFTNSVLNVTQILTDLDQNVLLNIDYFNNSINSNDILIDVFNDESNDDYTSNVEIEFGLQEYTLKEEFILRANEKSNILNKSKLYEKFFSKNNKSYKKETILKDKYLNLNNSDILNTMLNNNEFYLNRKLNIFSLYNKKHKKKTVYDYICDFVKTDDIYSKFNKLSKFETLELNNNSIILNKTNIDSNNIIIFDVSDNFTFYNNNIEKSLYKDKIIENFNFNINETIDIEGNTFNKFNIKNNIDFSNYNSYKDKLLFAQSDNKEEFNKTKMLYFTYSKNNIDKMLYNKIDGYKFGIYDVYRRSQDFIFSSNRYGNFSDMLRYFVSYSYIDNINSNIFNVVEKKFINEYHQYILNNDASSRSINEGSNTDINSRLYYPFIEGENLEYLYQQ